MDNTQYLKDLADTEKRKKKEELDAVKQKILNNIQTQQDQTRPTFQQQRNQASTQSILDARNDAEFFANRGQTSHGISAQAEMIRDNTLGNKIAGINTQEGQSLQGFNDQRNQANDDYTSTLTNAYNSIDTNLNQNLYNDRVRQQDVAEAERIRLANIEAQRQADYRQAELNRQADALKKLQNSQVITDYWQGDINPNTKYGTFETLSKNGVKYQPNNVGQYTETYQDPNDFKTKTRTAVNTLSAYKSNGKKVTVGDYSKATGKTYQGYTGADVSNQTVWVDKTGKAWYWDGSINNYRAL